MTPDPLDALKYAYAFVLMRLDGQDNADDVADHLDALIEPFVPLGQTVDDFRYSDGSPVTVTSEYAPGHAFQTFRLPPGFPRKAVAS